MFEVFENDKSCNNTQFNVHKSWKNSKFNTYQEAKEYARKWLGGYIMPKDWDGSKFDYSGSGSIIEIRIVD